MRAMLLELSQPELFARVMQETIGQHGHNTPDVQRGYYLDALNSSDVVARELLKVADSSEANRYTKRINGALYSQPIEAEGLNTMWQPYMAATYAVDHLSTGRGEFAEDNRLDSALFGSGREIKARALELAIAYSTRN